MRSLKFVRSILQLHFLFIIPFEQCSGFSSQGRTNHLGVNGKSARIRITSQKNSLDEGVSSENFSVVIGKGSALNLDGDGTLTFSDSLLVDGFLAGKLKCLADNFEGTLVKIGVEGELLADVNCVAVLEVLGSLTGDIQCRRLVVGPGASIVGNIVSESIHLSEGSSVFGSIATGGFAIQNVGACSEPEEEKFEDLEYEKQQQSISISTNIYHDIVQKAALEKGRAAGLGVSRNGRSPESYDDNRTKNDTIFDDFGNQLHPLIRGADDDQVASFREIRNLSSRTRNLLDTHKKKKERDLIRRKAAPSPEVASDDDNTCCDEDSDEDQMPSFLR